MSRIVSRSENVSCAPLKRRQRGLYATSCIQPSGNFTRQIVEHYRHTHGNTHAWLTQAYAYAIVIVARLHNNVCRIVHSAKRQFHATNCQTLPTYVHSNTHAWLTQAYAYAIVVVARLHNNVCRIVHTYLLNVITSLMTISWYKSRNMLQCCDTHIFRGDSFTVCDVPNKRIEIMHIYTNINKEKRKQQYNNKLNDINRAVDYNFIMYKRHCKLVIVFIPLSF